MHRFQATLVALALFVAVGATPALAARTIPQLVGASATLAFGPPTCQLGQQTCTYVFSNQGTARGERSVTWRYDEQGTVFADFSQEIASATYTITVLDGKSGKPAETIVL